MSRTKSALCLVGCGLAFAVTLGVTPALGGQPPAAAPPAAPPPPSAAPPASASPPGAASPPAEPAPAAEAPPTPAGEPAPATDAPPPPPAEPAAAEPSAPPSQATWQWPFANAPGGAADGRATRPGSGPVATPDDESMASDDDAAPLPRDLDHLMLLELGFRSLLIADEGFEPYADGDVSMLGQLALAAHVLPFKFAPMTIGIGAEYSVGNRSEVTRGQDASLTTHRIAGSVLIDATIIRHLHTFARFAPAALYLHGTIEDAALPGRPLVTDPWTWAIDTTGGLSVLLGAAGDDQAPAVGFWLSAEFGYCFAGDVEMVFSPEEDEDDSRQFGDLRMPDLNPGGVLNRFAFGLTF